MIVIPGVTPLRRGPSIFKEVIIKRDEVVSRTYECLVRISFDSHEKISIECSDHIPFSESDPIMISSVCTGHREIIPEATYAMYFKVKVTDPKYLSNPDSPFTLDHLKDRVFSSEAYNSEINRLTIERQSICDCDVIPHIEFTVLKHKPYEEEVRETHPDRYFIAVD